MNYLVQIVLFVLLLNASPKLCSDASFYNQTSHHIDEAVQLYKNVEAILAMNSTKAFLKESTRISFKLEEQMYSLYSGIAALFSLYPRDDTSELDPSDKEFIRSEFSKIGTEVEELDKVLYKLTDILRSRDEKIDRINPAEHVYDITQSFLKLLGEADDMRKIKDDCYAFQPQKVLDDIIEDGYLIRNYDTEDLYDNINRIELLEMEQAAFALFTQTIVFESICNLAEQNATNRTLWMAEAKAYANALINIVLTLSDADHSITQQVLKLTFIASQDITNGLAVLNTLWNVLPTNDTRVLLDTISAVSLTFKDQMLSLINGMFLYFSFFQHNSIDTVDNPQMEPVKQVFEKLSTALVENGRRINETYRRLRYSEMKPTYRNISTRIAPLEEAFLAYSNDPNAKNKDSLRTLCKGTDTIDLLNFLRNYLDDEAKRSVLKVTQYLMDMREMLNWAKIVLLFFAQTAALHSACEYFRDADNVDDASELMDDAEFSNYMNYTGKLQHIFTSVQNLDSQIKHNYDGYKRFARGFGNAWKFDEDNEVFARELFTQITEKFYWLQWTVGSYSTAIKGYDQHAYETNVKGMFSLREYGRTYFTAWQNPNDTASLEPISEKLGNEQSTTLDNTKYCNVTTTFLYENYPERSIFCVQSALNAHIKHAEEVFDENFCYKTVASSSFILYKGNCTSNKAGEMTLRILIV